MATTKKPRSKKKIASSEPVAGVPTKRVLARKTGRVFHIHLIEGASYSSKGFNFAAGRPVVTADEKVYEAFKSNGRFRIDVREGGAQ